MVTDMIPNGSETRDRLIASGYTPEQLNLIDAVLADTFFAEDDYEYADNLRIARVGNDAEVAEYERLRGDGCCGSFDREYPCAGANILIGFNYGH